MISEIYVIINGTDTIIFSLVRGNLQGHIAAGTDNFPVPIHKQKKKLMSTMISQIYVIIKGADNIFPW